MRWYKCAGVRRRGGVAGVRVAPWGAPLSDLPIKHVESSIALSPTRTEPARGAPSTDRAAGSSAQGDRDLNRTDAATPAGGPVGYAGELCLSPDGGGAGRFVAGFVFIVLGGVVAVLSPETCTLLWSWADESWTGEWLRWVLAAVMVLVGGSCLRSNLVFYLVTSALVGVTAMCVNELGRLGLTHVSILPGSLALGYAIHAARCVSPPSARGVLGLALIVFAGLSVVRSWYAWENWSELIGSGWQGFFESWGAACSWGAVLILTAVGVSSSRTRPVHFLNAVILGALAYYCLQNGKVVTIDFPEFNRSIEHVSLANIEPWRWAVIGELVLLSVVLLYKALGMGSLTVGFAVVWMLLGLHVYGSIGTLSLVKVAGDQLATAVERQGRGTAPFVNMGLPIPTRSADSRNTTLEKGGRLPSNRGPSASSSGRFLPAENPGTSRDQALAKVDQEGLVREALPLVWMFLLALWAGVIATAGSVMLLQDPGPRRWACCGLWFGFGLAAASLWSSWASDPDQDWLVWLAGIHPKYLLWLTFLGTMTVFGSWALRGDSPVEPWIRAAVAAILLGTASSLVGAALLDRFGGFPPLPVWVFFVVAVGQSSLMWVLLFELHGPFKEETASEVVA